MGGSKPVGGAGGPKVHLERAGEAKLPSGLTGILRGLKVSTGEILSGTLEAPKPGSRKVGGVHAKSPADYTGKISPRGARSFKPHPALAKKKEPIKGAIHTRGVGPKQEAISGKKPGESLPPLPPLPEQSRKPSS
jgi:hypothetical protein